MGQAGKRRLRAHEVRGPRERYPLDKKIIEERGGKGVLAAIPRNRGRGQRRLQATNAHYAINFAQNGRV